MGDTLDNTMETKTAPQIAIRLGVITSLRDELGRSAPLAVAAVLADGNVMQFSTRVQSSRDASDRPLEANCGVREKLLGQGTSEDFVDSGGNIRPRVPLGVG